MEKSHEKAIAVNGSDRQTNMFSNRHSNRNSKITPQELLEVVKTLPKEWGLVAVGDKKTPLGKNWTNLSLTQENFEKAIQAGQFESLLVESTKGETFYPPIAWWFAVGVLCGTPSRGLLFVDHDGISCDSLIEKLSGQCVVEALPKTVAVTSGREGRYQLIYKIPERFWGAVSTKKLPTGAKGENGEIEQLEFRWDGSQSVVAGYHPITGSYYWLPGQSPQECAVAEAPEWVIELFLRGSFPNQSAQTKLKERSILQAWTEQDWARSYLSSIPCTEDYDLWLKVGMALHSVSEDLLTDWDNWSKGATNYESSACENHWRSFKTGGGIGIGTLGLIAKQNGWRSPFKKSSGNKSRTIQSSNKEADEDFEELAQEVQSLVKLTEEPGPIQNLLSPSLTVPLMRRAKQFNVPLEAFVGVLLPITASLLKIGTQLEIAASTEYRCFPILWTGLVGESGANKSPVLDTVAKPLEWLQAQADEIHQLKFAQFEDELEDWQKCSKEERGNKPTPPIQREYYLQDTTMEAIAACLSTQPDRGVVISVDELAGFFKGLNQYRSAGRGNDRQKLLSTYDGRAIKVNRKVGNRISLSKTSISLTGTIQPCVLRNLMSDLEQVDGFWARFLWIPLPLTEMPPPEEGVNHDLTGLLRSLYQGLEALSPQIYQFDQQGKTVWKDWHIFCEKNKVDEPNPSLRAIYPKSKERAARIALVIHCVNAAVEERLPEKIVSSETLQAAIRFTKWLIGQTRLIYADAGITFHPNSSKITNLVRTLKLKKLDWVSARQVTRASSSKNRPDSLAAQEIMKQMVNLGYAIDNGCTGKAYRIRIKDNLKSDNTGNKAPQAFVTEGFETGNKRGNKVVTKTSKSFETPAKPEVEAGNNGHSFVTRDQATAEGFDSKDFGKLGENLLPDVTSFVTTLEASSTGASVPFCHQVTASKFEIGDRVVLTGEGTKRPANELQAIWSVEAVQENGVLVHCEELGNRTFPSEWLALYERPQH